MMKRFTLGLLVCAATISGVCAPASADDGRALQIYVSKATQSLVVYDGDAVVATSRVSTGKAGHTTPSGVFSILQKQRYHESNIYSDAPMPWMQRLTWSGIALHESNSVPRHAASHGCVRLPANFAHSLYRMTKTGAHVIITDDEVTPRPVYSPTLFNPAGTQTQGEALSDADLRPTSIQANGSIIEVAMAKPLPKPAAGSAASPKAAAAHEAPLRILITRRDMRETVHDVQDMLTELGFDAGTPDGVIGSKTRSAIAGYKRWKKLPEGPQITTAFLDALHESAGRSAAPNGQLLVRQNFRPVFEGPIEIADPQRPLGTHFLEATHVDRAAGKADWHGVTMDNYIPSPTARRLGIDTDSQASDMEEALSRITVPGDLRAKIATLLDAGSSITITDASDPRETGRGTDFITMTRPTPRS
ncbi:L,D-transpeptidase family protein [Rhizobium halophytocola]|uniref:Peptidoglycan hydrolase-like protein with peptidoglycan-binding domain n=1 Tax=Rhizobium halophytocola TaxID=735519 RepID=A0ABS4DY25_9HYPH|nr:L,D-transpeptidase family protein [Rhizobium halophytocola]MBP1850599.1 peptidoglycan hydrolase-like protein with peptidoglycan-binding domain [Rhizobium halophytocola]